MAAVVGDENDSAEVDGHSGIKSAAIVKYSSTEMPARYQELQPNTNLNNPPSNWLHGNNKWESYIQSVSLGQEHSFSSFRMAHCYLELTGEIDVVSDAENIKQLLKMPFNEGSISMMVHRVGNTLMLDDFDVHRHLLRQQEDDWKWLRKFFFETVLDSVSKEQRDKWVIRKNKRRDHLQNRNMFSKFLYYSMTDGKSSSDERSSLNPAVEPLEQSVASSSSTSSSPSPSFSSTSSATTSCSSCQQTAASRSPSEAPHLSQPSGNSSDSEHQRTVEWMFEDIRMLIGTDLPIFGGGVHPCVSLRLRDMQKPINVLTGLDYWLDNLMCNVPELAMCYHDNGIVKSYELIKTEDIPNMANSRFSPTVVKDVAQNILSFLKSNATKEGHTYWLFRGYDDDIVKLYDLTTLCSHLMDDQNSNPFTVPLGALLYRVARNMRVGTQQCSEKKRNVIHTLLLNCLYLLNADKHSQLVTSAHYLLSDIYVSDDIESREESPVESSSAEESDAEEQNETEPTSEDDEKPPESSSSSSADNLSSVEVKALCVHEKSLKKNDSTTRVDDSFVRYPPISTDSLQRCNRAIHHIAQGLSVLTKSSEPSNSSASSSSRKNNIVEEQRQCDPNTAIPLFYRPLDPDLSIVQSRTSAGSSFFDDDDGKRLPVDPSSSSSSSSADWKSSSKMLLLRKASIAFCRLAKAQFDGEKLASALRYIKRAIHCFVAVNKLLKCDTERIERNHVIFGSTMMICGDILLALAHVEEADAEQEDDNDGGGKTTNQKLSDVVSGDIWDSSENETDEDVAVIRSVVENVTEDFAEYQWISEPCAGSTDVIQKSARCYGVACDVLSGSPSSAEKYTSALKRFGNAQNELGVRLMDRSLRLITNAIDRRSTEVRDLWSRSEECFFVGIKSFDGSNDALNSSLVRSNHGRLLRLQAQTIRLEIEENDDPKKREFTSAEKHLLYQAADCYEKCLSLFASRDSHPDLYDSLLWELSSVYFKMATLLQDYAPISTTAQQEIEKELVALMLKALDRCNSKTSTRHELAVQYRSASIQHRLASMYHNAYRNESSNQKQRQCRLLAEKYYAETIKIFCVLESSLEIIRVQLERVGLCEYQLLNRTSDASRTVLLHEALGYLVGCGQPLVWLTDQMKESSSSGERTTKEVGGGGGNGLEEEASKLVFLVETRLRATLLSLTKCAFNTDKKSKSSSVDLYKSMYAKSLATTIADRKKVESLIDTCQHQINILKEISQLFNRLQNNNSSQDS